MIWQDAVVLGVVGLAVAYIVWKVRGGRRKRRGPDVKAKDLVRKRDR